MNNFQQQCSSVAKFAKIALLVIAVLLASCFLLLADLTCAFAEESSASPTTSPSSARIKMNRLYNPWTGEHFYTAKEDEKKGLVAVGWNDEGVGWYAPSSGDEVYRLYNKFVPGGDHCYTTSETERDGLKKLGWRDEGRGWYSVSAGDYDREMLYRQYNPNEITGTHNYTLSDDENDNLVKTGWEAEGIGWYGYASNIPTTATDAFAVYSAQDGSLDFYKRKEKPSAGVEFNKKIATKIYYGIESDKTDVALWNNKKSKIVSSTVVDSEIKPLKMQKWFNNATSLKKIAGLDKLDMSSVTDLSYMFYECTSLAEIQGLSGWDTSKVTDFSNMFEKCDKLKNIDASNWNFDGLKKSTNITLSNMFVGDGLENLTIKNWTFPDSIFTLSGFLEEKNCPNLKTIDMSGWSDSNFSSIAKLCCERKKLTTVNLTGLDTSNLKRVSEMFSECPLLTYVEGADELNTVNVLSMWRVFYDCPKLTADCSAWIVVRKPYHEEFSTNSLGVVEPKWKS